MNNLLDDPRVYESMSQATNPYGDGHASQKILSTILQSIMEEIMKNNIDKETVQKLW